MKYRLHILNFNDLIIESGKREYKIDNSGVKELDYSFCFNNFKGGYKEIVFEHFRISYGKGKTTKNLSVDFDFVGETVEMHFTINGNTSSSINNLKNNFVMTENTHNIFYCSEIQGRLDWLTNNVFVFEVNLLPSFFKRYLPNNTIFKKFKKQIQRKELGYINKNNYPITAEMFVIIQQIINCNFKDTLRRLFIESKVLELLMLQIEQIQLFSGILKKENFNKGIVDKMHYAKELILQKFDAPLSLSELSLALNTNECTLKRDFKATFGTTVFGYVKELKMNKAKELLLNKHTIAEVADFVGYKNPQHFATAFKKYYGVVPSMLKE